MSDTPSPSAGRLPPRLALVAIALTASSTVAAEVLLTRVLSVATWYGLVFAVLSLAMVGLAAGSLEALRAQKAGLPPGPWCARRMVALALGLAVAVAVAAAVPLSLTWDLTSLASVLLVATAAAWPMASSGGIIACLLAETPLPASRLYAVDLVAAAIGSLAPLVLVGPMSPQSVLLLLGVGLSLTGAALAPARQRTPGLAAAALLAILLALAGADGQGLPIRTVKVKNPSPQSPLFQRWNPLSLVTVGLFVTTPEPFLWGPPDRVPQGQFEWAMAHIDAGAATPLHAYRTLADLAFLRYDVTSVAHELRPRGTACVIGVGAGRDVLTALLSGHERVVGFEINPAMLETLEVFRDKMPLLDDPRVELHLADGRAGLANLDVHCSVVQASLVDTWAATVAGAFAHTEATLYTREAWRLFLRRVEPDGILTFSRWYAPERAHETARLLALAVGALEDRGVSRPLDHLALVGARRIATVLLSPQPLSLQDRQTLSDLERQGRLSILAAPDRLPSDPVLAAILAARSPAELTAAGAGVGLDTSLPTDDRPFFFQLLRPSCLLRPSAYRVAEGVMSGNLRAIAGLGVAFVAVGLLGAALLGPTLWRAARASESLLPGWQAGVYFAGLGAGFMIVEVALVQRMHVALGHPTWALVVVLAGLLAASGAGSALSGVVVRTRAHVRWVAVAAALLLALLPYVVIRPLAASTEGAPLLLRALWTGGCAALVGLLLGMLFPAGLRFLARDRGTPVALALNGVASVLGSVGAIAISVWAGIPASFAVAAAVYAVVALVAPPTWPPVE